MERRRLSPRRPPSREVCHASVRCASCERFSANERRLPKIRLRGSRQRRYLHASLRPDRERPGEDAHRERVGSLGGVQFATFARCENRHAAARRSRRPHGVRRARGTRFRPTSRWAISIALACGSRLPASSSASSAARQRAHEAAPSLAAFESDFARRPALLRAGASTPC